MSSIGYEVSPETLRDAEEDLTAEGLAALDRRAASVADPTQVPRGPTGDR